MFKDYKQVRAQKLQADRAYYTLQKRGARLPKEKHNHKDYCASYSELLKKIKEGCNGKEETPISETSSESC